MDATPEITGRRTSASWEKQSFYKLSNGWTACVEYSTVYGEFVKRLDHPDGQHFWVASSGLDPTYHNDPDEIVRKVFRWHIACPAFAREWAESVGAGSTLIRPHFAKV